MSIYGLHRAVLLYFYFTGCGQFDLRALGNPNQKNSCIPRITVQLPVFNERFVVSKAIDSLSRLRYPRDRFEIQVLDDSTDETTNIAQAAVRSWRSKGISIQYRHRASRTGFKAGALAEGLREATGDLVAVFDADFLPEPNFLERVVGVFDNPCIGMVQARWDHSNRDHSLLTRLQALFLDGHFVLEHGGRFRGGCFFNFNGTAGVWRRAAIDSAGGWHTDTLTEDLDLSYRAQLAGWQFVFL
ncbi:MAG: glycosyltransferase, partial [Vicinamibacterales bacterium]